MILKIEQILFNEITGGEGGSHQLGGDTRLNCMVQHVVNIWKTLVEVDDAPVREGDLDQRERGGGGGERLGVLAGRLHFSHGQ